MAIFSKRALKPLDNQTEFDSAIRRFDPSRPSQKLRFPEIGEAGLVQILWLVSITAFGGPGPPQPHRDAAAGRRVVVVIELAQRR
ncbi:hypothetical protein ABIF96_004778 [Bradyrhizobium ottawaense]|uniref:hypothetical protein n=1 Tax=Bradyrhizobium ottawaense TaxID=931866 RepID=UPI0038387E49